MVPARQPSVTFVPESVPDHLWHPKTCLDAFTTTRNVRNYVALASPNAWPMRLRMKYSINAEAYCKVVLHAAKYANGAVYGILLGETKDDRIEVVNALPIAHSSLTTGTSPLTQAALMMAAAYAETSELSLVGLYYAPETADDEDIPVMPTRLAHLIRQENESACLLFLDAPRLAPDKRERMHCFKVFVVDSGPALTTVASGIRPDGDLVVAAETLALCHRALLSAECTYSVSDFEDHCLDVQRDWFNTGLLASIGNR
jgi:ER membrane protein complex subunit 8/9